MSVNSTSSQYPTGWMYGLLASHLRTNRMHLRPHAHGDTHMASILLTILPIIVRIVPVVKVNEEPVVDSSSNGCYADEWRVLPVYGFQLHPRTESWRCDWLNRADNTWLKKKAWYPGTESIEISLILLKCVHMKWHTVLRLLKRCLGASWPLQFFTYVFQLNSPSLQPVKS